MVFSNKKGQATVEMIALLALSLVALLVIYSIYTDLVLDQTQSRDLAIAESSLNKIVSGVDFVTSAGVGSEKRILIEIPQTANMETSYISGNLIILNFDRNFSVFRTTDVNLEGSFRDATGRYWITLYYDGNVVHFYQESFELSEFSFDLSASPDTNYSRYLLIKNDTPNTINFSLTPSFSYSNANLNISNQEFTLNPFATQRVDLNFVFDSTASGNYSGKIDVIGTINNRDITQTVSLSANIFEDDYTENLLGQGISYYFASVSNDTLNIDYFNSFFIEENNGKLVPSNILDWNKIRTFSFFQDKQIFFSGEEGIPLGNSTQFTGEQISLNGKATPIETGREITKLNSFFDSNLLALYHFNDKNSSSYIFDSANNNDCSLKGNSDINAKGLFDSTAFFVDGVDGSIAECTNSNSLVGSAQELTFSLWFKTTSSEEAYLTSLKRDYTSQSTGISFQINEFGGGDFTVLSHNGSQHVYLTDGNFYTDGIWHHAVVVVTESSRKIYMDGELTASDTNTTDFSFGSFPFAIGGFEFDRTDLFFDGSIEEVAIWDTNLSSSEISSLYEKQSGLFKEEGMVSHYTFDKDARDLKGENHGVMHGVEPTEGLWNSNAFYFDGINDYIKVSDSEIDVFGNNDWAVSYWVYDDGNKRGVVSYGDGDADYYWRHFKETGGNDYTFQFDDDVDKKVVRNVGEVKQNAWSHFVIAHIEGTGYKIYQDKEEIASLGDNGSLDDVNNSLYIGSDAPDGFIEYFKGKIEEVTIWNKALTEEDVNKLYNYNTKSHTNGLVGLWHLNDNAVDSSGQGNHGSWGGTESYSSGLWDTNAINLEGNNYVSLPTYLFTRKKTMSLWFKANDLSLYDSYVATLAGFTRYTTTSRYGSGLRFLNGYLVGISSYNNYEWQNNLEYSTENLDNDKWYMATLTFTGFGENETGKLYINGNKVAEHTGDSTPYEGGYDSIIGAGYADSQYGAFFNGQIEEVAVWDRELNSAEIQNLYEEQKGKFVESNLVAYYPLNGNSSDLSGNNLNGSWSGNESYISGLWDTQAGDFDGSSYINFEGVNDFSMNDGSNDFPLSVSAWIWQQENTYFPIVTKMTGDTSNWEWFFSVRNNENFHDLAFRFYSGGGADTLYSAIEWDNSEEWTHVTCTYDGSQTINGIKCYINGELGKVVSSQNTSYDGATYNQSPLHVGVSAFNSSYINYANGQIEEVSIWDKALTEKEIEEIYKEHSGYYKERDIVAQYHLNGNANDSIGNNNGTWGGTESYSSGLWDTQAGDFDGSSSYIGVSDFVSGLNQISVSGWINLDSISGDQGFIGKWGSAPQQILIYHDDPNGWRFLTRNDTGGTCDTSYNSDGASSTGEWIYITGVWDSSGCKLYIDSALKAESNSSIGNIATSSKNLRIGQDSDGTRKLNGQIEEVTIWKKALSENEIKDLYEEQAGKFAESNMVGLWHLNNNANDSSGNGNNGSWSGTESYSSGLWDTNAGDFDGSSYVDLSSLGKPYDSYSYWTKNSNGSWDFHLVSDENYYVNGISAEGNNNTVSFDYWDFEGPESRSGGYASSTAKGTILERDKIQGENITVAIDAKVEGSDESATLSLAWFEGTSFIGWLVYQRALTTEYQRYYIADQMPSNATRLAHYYTPSKTDSGTVYIKNGDIYKGEGVGIGVNNFEGKIEEVAIWDKTFSEEEVLEMYNEQLDKYKGKDLVSKFSYENGVYDDIKETEATLGGDANVNEEGLFGEKVLSLDGIGDYADIGTDLANIHQSDFSISAWINHFDTDTFGVILGGEITNSEGWMMRSYDNGEGTGLWFDVQYDTTNARFVSSDLIPEGLWVLVTAVWDRDSNSAKFYINGEEASYYEQTIGVGNPVSDVGRTKYIGSGYWTSDFQQEFIGKIGEITLWDRELRSEEILEMYEEQKLQLTDENLLAYYKFDEQKNNLIQDYGVTGNGELKNGADVNAYGMFDSNALDLDGVNDYVEISSIDQGTVHTHSVWIKLNEVLEEGYSMALSSDSTSRAYSVGLSYDDKILYNSGGTDSVSVDWIQDTQWHQITIVRENYDINFYVDGEKIGNTQTVEYNSDWNLNFIGIRDDLGTLEQAFNGQIDEVKIYNKALTEEEIIADYNSFLEAKMNDSNFLDVGFNALWEGIKINNDLYYDFGEELETNYEGTSKTSEIDVNNNNNSSSENLIALYHLNENANDSSGQGNNGSWSGTESYSSGLWDTSAGSFDGTNNIFVPSLNESGDFSISFWGKASSINSGGNYFLNFLGSGDRIVLGFHSGSSPGTFNYYDDGVWRTSNFNVLDSKWHNYVVTKTGTNYKLFADGQNILSGTGNNVNLDSNLYIGQYPGSNVEEVAIWNKALTEEEIAEMYKSQIGDFSENNLIALYHLNENANDSSGQGNNGTWGGTESYENGLWNTNAGDFDGSTDYITASYSRAASPLESNSFSAWVYPQGSNPSDAVQGIVSIMNGNLNAQNTMLINVDGNGVLCASYLSTDHASTSYNPIPLNKWSFVTCSFNASGSSMTTNLYINGELKDYNLGSGDYQYTSDKIQIGAYKTSMSRYFNGQIEEVAVWNKALTEEQVRNLYRKGIGKLDLNVYACNDSECNETIDSIYIENASNNSSMDISSLDRSQYIGWNAYIKPVNEFVGENAGRFNIFPFIQDVNILYSS